MSFDQEPDPPLHGECAAEISLLKEKLDNEKLAYQLYSQRVEKENDELRAIARMAKDCLQDLSSGDLFGANRHSGAQHRRAALRNALALWESPNVESK